jgi:hypothetical protein
MEQKTLNGDKKVFVVVKGTLPNVPAAIMPRIAYVFVLFVISRRAQRKSFLMSSGH